MVTRKKSNRNIAFILIISMMISMVPFLQTDPVYAATGLNVTQHSKSEIINYIKNSGVSVKDNHSFTITPEKYNTAGDLSPQSKESALAMLNNIRFVAGLPEVELNDTYGKLAQAGAFVNWCINKLTHFPKQNATKPDGMSDDIWENGATGAGATNIAWGQNNLNSAVLSWMDDEDKNNVAVLGHRRWQLNPKMGKTGFGASVTANNSYTQKYYALYSFDSSGQGDQTNVAWPATYMPIEFFGDDIPWSLSTGTRISNPASVNVSLTRREDSPSGAGSWSFTGAGTYTPAGTGKYFNVDNDPYGQSGCVIFRPDNISYKVGDIFDVVITGAASNAISYTVEFICGYPVETMSFDEEEYRLEYNSETIKPTVTPSGATEYEVSYSSSDESVVTVNEHGTVTRVGTGTATITATVDGKYTLSGQPLTSTYTIKVPKSITETSISYNQHVDYTGRKADLGISITDGDKVLQEGVDYIVSIPDDAIKPNLINGANYNYSVAISGLGDYCNRANRNFWINKRLLSYCTIVLDPNPAEYSGELQTPSVSVLNGDLLMAEGVDYTVTANSGGTNKGDYTVRVTAASDSDCYQGSASATFSITAKAITEDMIDDIPAVTYSGDAHQPDVTVTNNGMTLTKGTDYTVAYGTNVDAGKGSVTITGKGNYAGSVDKQFDIEAKQLAEEMVTLDEDSYEYSGALQKPTVTVKDGNKELVEGEDYTLTNDGGTNAGEYNVVVEGMGNYTGSVNKTFTITKKALSDSMITISPEDFTYDGSLQKPETVSVKFDEITLTEDEDYTLTNEGGVDAGDYSVTIVATADGNYQGSASKTYTINQKTITSNMIYFDHYTFVYNKSNQKPEVSVHDDTRDLTEEDCEILNEGGTDAGTYAVTVTGKGNYTGSAERTFDITKVEITDEHISGVEDKTYTGKEIEQDNLKVTVNGLDLILDTDFTVTYENNINAAKASDDNPPTLTIEGIGSYFGGAVSTFDINKVNLSDVEIDMSTEFEYTGSEITPIPTITYLVEGETYTLKNDVDYSLAYKDNTIVADEESEYPPTVTIVGKGNFDGERDVKFSIVPADISRATVEGIVDKIYNGEAQTQDMVVKLNGRKLDEGWDYDVKYFDNLNVGTATVEITGKDNYTGKLTKTFEIKLKKTSIADAVVSGLQDKTYTGKAINQTPTVKIGNTTLKKDKDYTFKIINNTKVGTATVTITGKGNYEGEKKATFKITPISLAKATVTGVEDKPYTGKAVTQTPTVELDGKTLKSGTDYTLSYKNNKNAGTATMTVTGKGNYSGTVSKTFKIIAKSKIWERVAGQTGFDTMAAITQKFGKADNAVIAANSSFRDSLAAAGLAGSLQAPMMLTNPGGLPDQTKSELKRMGVKTVYLVGSTKDVSAQVETQIKNLNIKVVRITGNTPSQKAVNVAKKQPSKSDTVIIATPAGFKDALSISPYAYATKSPVLYAENNKKLSAATVNYIKTAKFKKAIIVGGYIALPLDIETQLKGAGIKASNITRLAGANGYATSQVIAEWGQGKVKNGTGTNGQGKGAKDLYYYAMIKFQPTIKMTANNVGISRGDTGDNNWRDALAGAALCGKNRAILLLVHDENTSNTAVTKASKAQIAHGYVFGGEGAVGKKSWNALVKSTN